MVGQQCLVLLPQWDHMPSVAKLSHSVFSEDIDDDDDKGGGMLIPAQIPIQ
jgi:hypothetical protein